MTSPQRLALVVWLLVLHTAADVQAHSRMPILKSERQLSHSYEHRRQHHSRSLLYTSCGGSGPAKPQGARSTATSAVAATGTVADGSSLYAMPDVVGRLYPTPSSNNMGLVLVSGGDDSIGPDAIHTQAAGPSSAVPSSVCPHDKPFTLAKPSNTTCRLVLRTHQNKAYLCTAWFISPNHVATAGHCVARPGAYILSRDNPGYICCLFGPDGQCEPQYTWRLLQWVTTAGFYEDQRADNDGAVIEVAPANPQDYVPGVAQNLTSFSPGPVPAHNMYMDGYPGELNSSQ